MTRKKISKNKNTSRIKREHDSIPWRYCLLTLVCGLVLVGGFFIAARQHFSSIDYSIKNSQLKKQKDELETAKRQLVIARELALSPAEIKKTAKEYGFTDVAGTLNSLYSNKTNEVKSKVEKTSSTRPTNTNNTTTDKNKETSAKNEKKTVEKSESKNKKGTE